MFVRYRQLNLITRIIIGLAIGGVLGVVLPWLHLAPTVGTAVALLGTLFVGALKGIAPVLVFFLIMSAISKYEGGGESHFGTVIVAYLVATFLSAAAAVVASFLFKVELVFPTSVTKAAGAPKSLGTVITNLFTTAVANPLDAIVSGNYLAILFWAALIGFALRVASPGTLHALDEIANAIQRVAGVIIEFAPFGVVGLLYQTIADTGFTGIVRYGQLVALLVGTMAVVYLVLYPAMVWVMTRQNPFPLTWWTLKVSGIPAFFTRSGAVNIPINLQAAQALGLNEKSYAISIPLGGSANSGGAAITIVIMTLAACFTLGIQVSLPLAVLLCILTTIASTGVSGIAGGSLLIIPLAASLFGISNDIAMQVVGIGFIIGVIQDAVETAVNSAADLLFTAAGEYHDLRKAGRPVDMQAAVRAAKAKM